MADVLIFRFVWGIRNVLEAIPSPPPPKKKELPSKTKKVSSIPLRFNCLNFIFEYGFLISTNPFNSTSIRVTVHKNCSATNLDICP